MRILIVSDIHANLAALEAVLDDAGEFDQLWCLGDTVGYGPQPNDCIARLLEFPLVAIPGNHDWGVLGKLDLTDFNPAARLANLWNRTQLTPASRDWLDALPEVAVVGDVTLAHGSPRSPIWEYLLYASAAQANFGHFETKLCLVGHSHVPVIFADDPGKSQSVVYAPAFNEQVQLDDRRYIINPGSVGQPRDQIPDAAYMLYDTETYVFVHRRVPYDVAATQALMRAAGLPDALARRLEMGW